MKKKVCMHCQKLPLQDKITSPQVFLDMIKTIDMLVQQKQFIILKQTYTIKQVLQSTTWCSDILEWEIQCPICDTIYYCYQDTYHGNGSFTEKEYY